MFVFYILGKTKQSLSRVMWSVGDRIRVSNVVCKVLKSLNLTPNHSESSLGFKTLYKVFVMQLNGRMFV